MPHTIKHIIAYGCMAASALSGAACEPRRIPPMTVSDLMEDRVMLDGVLMKCNESAARARNDSDCRNARIAIDRLALDVDPAEEAKRSAEFERSREQLRLAQERKRRDLEAKNRVDGYDLPMLPVDPAPATSGPPAATQATQPKL